jgi:hypothetical protein
MGWLMPLTILLVGLWAYHNSFGGVFLCDDLSSIVDNPRIRQLGTLWDAIWADPGAAIAGRPVPALSLALNYAVSGLNVWSYHVVNLSLHLLCALLAFGIVRRTLLTPRLQPAFGRGASWLALATAALWVAHPLLAQSVTYIIQRAEMLMGLFYLLTLYGVIRSVGSPRPRLWHGLAVASCALGMASKEVMVSAPLIVWLYDRTFLSGSFRRAYHERRGLYAGLAMTWWLLAALVVPHPRGDTAGFSLTWLSPWRYALTQCSVLVRYLHLAVWPCPLILDYDGWPIARALSDVLPQAIAVVALLLATGWSLRARPALGFLGAWFFAILAPSSSVLPIATEVAAEHRMYLPLLAMVCLVVLGGWARLCRASLTDRLRRGIAAGIAVVLIGMLGLMTIRRNETYLDEVTMWQDVVAKNPGSPRGHYNLGVALGHQWRHEEAIEQLIRALELRPYYWHVWPNLVLARMRLGHFMR